jgi:WD40 repeat protein
LLASSSWDGTLRLWDVATGKDDKGCINGHGLGAEGGEFSPDGKTLTIVIKNGITLWYVPSHQERITLDRRVQGGGDLFFSPDGKNLATGAAIWAYQLQEVKGGVQFWQAPAIREH